MNEDMERRGIVNGQREVMREVPVRPLSKSELAWQYSPELSQVSALNRLSRWIKGDKELMRVLYATGYQDRQRILTAKQVAIIYEYLGTPGYDWER